MKRAGDNFAELLEISYTHFVSEEEKKLNPSARHGTPFPFPPKAVPPLAEGKGKQPPKAAPFVKVVKGDMSDFNLWQLAGELGFTIAVPIVIFALIGRWADNAFGTSPWLLLVGILVSIFFSSFMVYKKVSRILK